MGGGIWSMHFIGMLAFSLPCGVTYAPVGTVLSMIPGILASGVALHVIGIGTLWSDRDLLAYAGTPQVGFVGGTSQQACIDFGGWKTCEVNVPVENIGVHTHCLGLHQIGQCARDVSAKTRIVIGTRRRIAQRLRARVYTAAS